MIFSDVIIIGGGVGGMTCANYILRGGKSVLLIEKGIVGGNINYASSVENFPSYDKIDGYSLTKKIFKQISDFTKFKKIKDDVSEVLIYKVNKEKVQDLDKFNKEDLEYSNLSKSMTFEDSYAFLQNLEKNAVNFVLLGKDTCYFASAVVIATGTHNKKLEKNEGKYIGRGVSYCAVCDGTFFKDKEVAVIGSGNTAANDAIYLSDLAKKVTIVFEENNMLADNALVEKLQTKDNIVFLPDSKVVDLMGENKLEEIELLNKGQKLTLKCDGMFVAIGQLPNSDLCLKLVETDKKGYIITNTEMETKTSMLYAVGDVRKTPLRQLVTSCADGAIAGTEILKKLR